MVQTLGMSSTWIANGMQTAIDKACHDLVGRLNATATPPATQVSQENVEKIYNTRGRENVACTDSNLEKGLRLGYDHARSGHKQRLTSKHLAREEFHGIYSSVSSSMFGTIYFTTKEFLIDMSESSEESDSDESTNTRLEVKELRTNFTIYPAGWLVRLGLRFGLDASISTTGREWKHVFRTFHAVPDNALVFDLCKEGNLQAVRSLFKRGEASAWDTNSYGWTPLHVRYSAIHRNVRSFNPSETVHNN